MTENESAAYEAALASANGNTLVAGGHKGTAASIPLPSLTSKPLKHQQAMKEAPSDPPPSGYYFNVAQKGKLILPTALWILLVVAGITFLTLLASLNKTVDTLDTLVELEQEKGTIEREAHILLDIADRLEKISAVRGKRPEEERHKKRDHHAHGDREPLQSGADSFSWLRLPSWTSLEPVKTKPAAPAKETQGPPAYVGSIIDDMMRQMLGSANQADAPEISGSIIISSSSDAGDLSTSDGMVDSILKQVVPLFGGLKGAAPDMPPRKEANKHRLGRPSTEQPAAQSGPFISAKIENLNVHLGGPASEAKATKAPLENSIDDMVSNLMEEKISRGPLEVSEVRPIIEPIDMVRPGRRHDHHHRHGHSKLPPHSQSLSSLLVPIGMSPSLVPFPFEPANRPLDRISDNRLVGKLPGNPESRPHLHPVLEEPQVVISIATDDPQADLSSLVGGAPSLSLLENPPRAPIQPSSGPSPYELPVGAPISLLLDSLAKDFDSTVANKHETTTKKPKDGPQKIKDDTKWDMLSNDLASTFLESLMQPPSQSGNEAKLGSQPESESIVLLNGHPLAMSEGQKSTKSPSEASSKSTTPSLDSQTPSATSKDASALSDVLNLFFGPATPDSLIRSDEQQKPEKKSHAEEEADRLFDEMKAKLEQSTLESVSKAATGAEQAFSASVDPLSVTLVPSTGSPNKTSKSTPSADPTEAIVNELIGSMFTMPQFGGSSSQQQLGGSSGSGSSSPSAAVPDASEPASVAPEMSSTAGSPSSVVFLAAGPLSTPSTGAGAPASPKSDQLPGDSAHKGFLGLNDEGRDQFFTKEDLDLSAKPSETTSASANIKKVTTQAPTTTSAPPKSTTERSSPARTSTEPPVTAKTSSAELISSVKDIPSNVHLIDLTPFASPTFSAADESKLGSTTRVQATITSSPTTTSKPSTTSAAAARNPGGLLEQVTTSAPSGNSTAKPSKSFLEKADDFIGRNIQNLKKLF